MENSGLNKINFIAFLILFIYSITDLQFLSIINLVPFMASSKEQGLAGLDISFFTFTFKATAAVIKQKRLMYLFKLILKNIYLKVL